jgi:hypothetical protein
MKLNRLFYLFICTERQMFVQKRLNVEVQVCRFILEIVKTYFNIQLAVWMLVVVNGTINSITWQLVNHTQLKRDHKFET